MGGKLHRIMPENQSTVTKLKITGYEDDKFGKKSGSPISLQINPDSISKTFSVSYSNDSSDGKSCSSEKDAQGGIRTAGYLGSNPGSLTIEAVLDGTGLVEGIGYGELPGYVDKLLKLVYDCNGEAHRPLYLKLEWGSVFRGSTKTPSFKGQLSSCTVNYTLFSHDGIPLRAKLTLSLVEALSEDDANKLMGKKSPDMSHVITVRQGDKLPTLCEQIYGSGKYYLQVARINRLSNLFSLSPGQQLYFPPLEK